MRKYKFLKINTSEIDYFCDFINKMAKEGWHPVNSWTRFFTILKFEYDPFKKGDYAVIYNQYKTSVQLIPAEDKSYLQSSDDFDESLVDSEIEKITTYTYFDILYSDNEEKTLENLRVSDAIKKRVAKKRTTQTMFAVALYIFCIAIYYSMYSNSIVSLLETSILTLLILYSSILVGSIYDAIDSYRFYKGYPVRKKRKWDNLSNFNIHSLAFLSWIFILIFLISSVFYLVGASYSLLFTTLLLIMLIFLVAYIWYLIDKTINKRIHRNILKVIVTAVFAWMFMFINVSLLFNPLSQFNQDIQSKNPNLVNAICSKEFYDYTSHSFFVQKYDIYCNDSDNSKDVIVYEFKSQFGKAQLKEAVLKELGIKAYTEDVMFEQQVTYTYGTYDSSVLVTDRYIYLSRDKVVPMDINYLIEGRH